MIRKLCVFEPYFEFFFEINLSRVRSIAAKIAILALLLACNFQLVELAAHKILLTKYIQKIFMSYVTK